jgi:tRNA pseudouridine55 synthase
MTSAGAVAMVRRTLDAAKAGHGGTLDPLATGVLPIALGEATKTIPYVVSGQKIYRFTVRWGEERSTDDTEGEVTASSSVRPSAEAIVAVLGRFTGDIQQVPPAFSAVKIDGQRAYSLARADLPMALPARQVAVEAIELIDTPDADHAVFQVTSGKGAYMRALARDMARALGTVGHIAELRRLAVAPFVIAQAIPLDNAGGVGHSDQLAKALLPVEAALAGMPALALSEGEAHRLRNGQSVAVLPVASRSSLQHVARDAVFCATARGRLVALAEIKGGEIRPLRVLNL